MCSLIIYNKYNNDLNGEIDFIKVGYDEFQRNVLSLAHCSARDVAGNKYARLPVIISLYLSGFSKCFHSKIVAVKNCT